MLLPREYEVNPANVPSESVKRYKMLFVFLQVFGGQVGMPLFIGTMLVAPSVKRHLTLVNFCASWIIYSIVYCLTVYHGTDRTTGLGAHLCVAQAALVHGVVPLAVLTYCALHIQVWMGVRRAFSQTSWVQTHRRKLLISLFFVPYVAFTAFSVGSLVICLRHPELIDRTEQYYCTINYNPLVFAVPGFAAGVIAIMIILEIIIGVTLIRLWKAVRSSRPLNAASISMIVRIAIFSVYGFATLAACAAFLARSLSIWPYLVQASLPTAVFLMFGTRADVWRAWCPKATKFWRSDRRSQSSARQVSIQIMLDTQITVESDDSSRFNANRTLTEKKDLDDDISRSCANEATGRDTKETCTFGDVIVIGRRDCESLKLDVP